MSTPQHAPEIAEDPGGAEVERLRAQVAQLQATLAAREESGTRPPVQEGHRHPVRWIGFGVVMALVGLLAPLAILATWVHDEISDTDRYVQTVTPLASDPAVQDAIITRTTNTIMDRIDVQAVTQDAVNALSKQGLSPRATAALTALSVPIANGVRGFVENAVGKLVRSSQFQEAWVAANRVAHTQMVAVLTGKKGGAVQVSGNTVYLDLGPVIAQVKDQLTASGFSLASKIPTVTTQFPILESNDITKAQSAFRWLGAVARALPILALLLLALAVALAPARRKGLVIGAGIVAASMVMLGLVLNGFRSVYLDALPSDVSQSAAGAIYDTLAGFIRLNLRAVLVVFLAVAAIAWVTGPWGPAVATRTGTNRAIESVRHRSDSAGLGTGAFGAGLYRMRTAIRVSVLGLALLVYVLAAHPTGAFAITVLVVALLVLLLVELLARPPAPAPAGPSAAATVPAQGEATEPADASKERSSSIS